MRLAVPATQVEDAVPPPELMAAVKPYWEDVMVKYPPVVSDIVTATLVALTVRTSATDLAFIVRVVGGDVRYTFVSSLCAREAAEAVAQKRPERRIAPTANSK